MRIRLWGLALTLTAGWTIATPHLDALQQKKHVVDEWDDQTPTGLVIGRVVDATTGRPIANAIVTHLPLGVAPPGDAPPGMGPVGQAATRVLTNDDGRFLFRGLAAGQYFFLASATAYLDGGFGQQRPGGRNQPFALAEHQRVGDLTIRLWKEAMIAGTVTDDASEPVGGVWVTLSPARAGTLATATSSWRGGGNNISARTDDRGAYRFPSVGPGEYVVSVPSRMTQMASAATGAGVRVGTTLLQTSYEGLYGGSNVLPAILPTTIRDDGRAVGYATTFYPTAATIAAATPIAVRSGDDRAGVDIQLRPIVLTPVSGMVTGPAGPEPNLAVHLMPAYAAGTVMERTHTTAVTTTATDGRFSFVGVPPGPYILKTWKNPQISVIARDPLPPDATLWRQMPISVGDSPMANLTVTLQPGTTVSGRVRFEGSATPPMPLNLQTGISVAFEPMWPLAFAARLAARVSATYEFTTAGLPPGPAYANLPNNFTWGFRGWYFESAVHAGQDLTITPLALEAQPITDVVITFSDRRSEISGTVRDASGRPDAMASVVVFPADYRPWIKHGLSPLATRVETVTQSGTFVVPMRPGEYLVAAVADAAVAGWPNPQAVETLAAVATRVTIARGETRQLELRRR